MSLGFLVTTPKRFASNWKKVASRPAKGTSRACFNLHSSMSSASYVRLQLRVVSKSIPLLSFHLG